MDIFFDKEFRTLIPQLLPDELAGLEESLKTEGNRDPIVIWKEKQILLDGHNRYDICHKNDISLKPPMEMSFKDRESAQIWIIQNQFSRRNINLYQRSVLALKLEDIFRRKAKDRQVTSTGGNHPQLCQNSDKAAIDTKKELARLSGVSHDTIMKVKKIEAIAPEPLKERLRRGDTTINQVYVAINREEIRKSVKYSEWPDGKYRIIYADPPWQEITRDKPSNDGKFTFLEVIGFKARANALKDGVAISAAEAECMFDEPNWTKKPRFQLRSMAETRACAKALRNVLQWVVKLPDGNGPAPAEEFADESAEEAQAHFNTC